MESIIIKIYINCIKCLLYNYTIINCVDLKYKYELEYYFYLVEQTNIWDFS